MNTVIGTAWLLGLFGSVHCLGMCGGLSSALAFALPTDTSRARRVALLALMGAGRISSYALLGALGAALVPEAGGSGMTLPRIVAGVLLVLMGLSIAGWSAALAPLERAGHRVWQRIGPRALRIARLDRAGGALLAGAAWGWLPCGLVYSTLVWSASSGSTPGAAASMAAFGAGTLPAVLASGALAATLREALQRRGLRLLTGLTVAAFGVWTTVSPLRHAGHQPAGVPPQHSEHHAELPHHHGHGSSTSNQKR